MSIQSEKGFSLIEVLVALSVFSLAALALINAQGEYTSSVSRLEEKAIAAIVAENILVLEQVSPDLPNLGTKTGLEKMGSRDWLWRMEVRETGINNFVQLEVFVQSPDSEQVIYSLRGFKGNG